MTALSSWLVGPLGAQPRTELLADAKETDLIGPISSSLIDVVAEFKRGMVASAEDERILKIANTALEKITR